MKAAIVIPSIREVNSKKWIAAWKNEFNEHHIIVIEDNPAKSFQIKESNISHFSWEEIDRELGNKSWIIPRRTDCVRSFGFLKALEQKPDMIVTLDDDCLPDDTNFLALHWQALQKEHPPEWFQHSYGLRVRGLPYNLETIPTVLNMGLWSNIPDLDAKTQLESPDFRTVSSRFNHPVPKGYFAPLSGMNVAFKPEIVSAYYFLLMGEGHEYDRFGDIWAGIFLKKICDHLGFVISGGIPYVRHERASDPLINAKKEEPGLLIHEKLWRDVRDMRIEGSSFKECYISLAQQIPEYSGYWKKLKEAMQTWAGLY